MAAFRCLLAALVCAAVSAQGAADWEAFKAVSRSNLDFANSLYKVLSRKEGNLFFSPTSVHTILALTSQGARGTTAQQMITALHLPDDQQNTKDGFRYLINSLQDNETVTMKLANRIFPDSRFPPTPEFVRVAAADFHSSSEPVDFQHEHDLARSQINTWVEDNTEHKIKDLLPAGSVDRNTAMVLVNAIYFKGAWDKVFYDQRTMPKPFYVSADVTKHVPMMHLFVPGNFAYYDSQALEADILEIPYQGKKVSMVVILPKEKNGLRDVEARLARLQLSSITSPQVSYPNIHLSLPKFKLEESSDLKETLIEMGMGEMFSEHADLSGVAAGPLQVSKVVHKAFIEVDENGTEAAAATAVIIRLAVSRGPERPRREITFKADHPFIFMLVKKESSLDGLSSVLFMGRYVQPNQ